MFPRGYFAGDYFPGDYFPPVEQGAESSEAGWLPQHFITPRNPEMEDPDPLGEDFFFALT